MVTLLLRLEGPMQSWGITSCFDERDTGLEPSKSGIIGLLCAALGRDRNEPVDDLAALRMGVRVDKEGIPRREFQTATGIMQADGKPNPKKTVVSPRYYLSDASFLVGLEGQDEAFLVSLDRALGAPIWPPCLGRKAFVPGRPVRLENGGVRQGALLDVLRAYPLEAMFATKDARSCLVRFALESDTEGSLRLDQPIGPFVQRRFGPRCVRMEVYNVSVQVTP